MTTSYDVICLSKKCVPAATPSLLLRVSQQIDELHKLRAKKVLRGWRCEINRIELIVSTNIPPCRVCGLDGTTYRLIGLIDKSVGPTVVCGVYSVVTRGVTHMREICTVHRSKIFFTSFKSHLAQNMYYFQRF